MSNNASFVDMINGCAIRYSAHDPPRHRYREFNDQDFIVKGANQLIYYNVLTDSEMRYLEERVRKLKEIDIAYYFGTLGFNLTSLKKINLNRMVLLREMK